MNTEDLNVYFILQMYILWRTSKIVGFFLKLYLCWPYFLHYDTKLRKKVSWDFLNAKQQHHHYHHNRKYDVINRTKIYHWPQIRKSGPWNLVQTWTRRPGQNKLGTPVFGSRGTRTSGNQTPSGVWSGPGCTVWLSPRTRGASSPVEGSVYYNREV